MSQLSLCSGINKDKKICPLRQSCERFHAEPARKDQQWIEAPFRLKQCDHWCARKSKP